MALDLGLTTHQLLSAMDGVASNAWTRARCLDDTLERGLHVSADTAAGKPKRVALVACMRKLLVILNSMLKHGCPWRDMSPAVVGCSS